MPMTLRAKHEQAGRERALMSANCVALAADEARRRSPAAALMVIVDARNPRVGEQTWERN